MGDKARTTVHKYMTLACGLLVNLISESGFSLNVKSESRKSLLQVRL